MNFKLNKMLLQGSGFALSLIIKLWLKTLRYRPSGDVFDQKGIILFLHGHQFGLLLHKPNHPLITPISLSHDGDIQVSIMKQFGIKSVRGSRSKGAVSVLKALLRQSKQGHTLLIALDGSRGPYGVPQPGGFFLADKTKCPLWFCSITKYKGIRLKSWDRFILPYPFSTVHITTQIINMNEPTTSKKSTDSIKWKNIQEDLHTFIRQHNL
jgi:hypothetical protein